MRYRLLILVISLQVIALMATIIQHELGLSGGQEILLETAPVDPRDLLRGDYVILNYFFSGIAESQFQPPLDSPPKAGLPVYVALKSDGTVHGLSRVSLQPLTVSPDEILLRGEVDHRHPWRSGVPIKYGLERFYVHEGTGNPTGKLTVRARVSSRGHAQIVDVLVDGVPYSQGMKSQRKL